MGRFGRREGEREGVTAALPLWLEVAVEESQNGGAREARRRPVQVRDEDSDGVRQIERGRGRNETKLTGFV